VKATRSVRVLSRLAFSLVALVLLVACGRAVFSVGVRERYGFTAEDLRRVQFYTSDEIVLRREITDVEKESQRMGLVVRSGVVVEEIVIPRHTPCVAIRSEGDYLLMGFWPGFPTRSLWFAARGDAGTPSESRQYVLAALENTWDEPGPFEPRFAKGFLVTYGGQKYQVPAAQTWNVHLLYELDESYARKKIELAPKGWKLEEGVPPVLPSSTRPDAGPDGG
jgi:hypothetical protein